MVETKFKQTEIGLIPEDWEIKTLGDVCIVKGRIGFRGYTVKDLVKKGFGAISLSPSNITRHFELDFSDCTYISWFKYEESPEIKVEINDILFVKTGSTYGKTALIKFLPEKATINPQFALLKNIKCDPFFLSSVLVQSYIRKQVDECVVGGAVPTMSQKKIESFLFFLPKDKQEQSRIAEALSNIDQLIFSLSKIIEKKRLIKQGAMQQLLTGKKRLPGFDGEWVESELGTIVNIQRGSMLKSSEYQFGSIPVIAGGITPAGFHNVANRNGRTITISASGANAGYISYYKEPIFATDCSTISESNDYFIDFIYYVLLLKQNDIFRLQTGGAQPHIHPKDVAPLKINIPCLYDEQVAIANILSTMDNEIESLEEEQDKYIRLKEGMMQQLLTGQIRLVEAETKQQELPKAKAANVYFRRCVLAAEIADRLCEERTFGHVKMEKLIFLTEHLCHIDIDSHYHRDAAGPYDNRALRSIDSQMKKQKWFEAKKEDKAYRYIPMLNRGGHKKYFEKYYADVMPMFEKIIDTFRSSTTEQCEIVATLYSAWNDLLQSHQTITDDDILNEVLNNWHESKKRINRNRWQTELDWMRANGFMPQTENN